MATPLSKLLTSVDTPAGRARLAQVLSRKPFPHFEAHPDLPGVLVRIDEQGNRTAGRFVERKFVQLESPSRDTQTSDDLG
jgi:hypothetical protein